MRKVKEVMANTAQMLEVAKRRRRIIDLCRGIGMTVTEISKVEAVNQRSIRNDIEQLVELGYMEHASSKMVGMMDTAIYKTVADPVYTYPLPDEEQRHPKTKAVKRPEVLPAGGRIVRFT
jgi:DeoR/GlpR family transcriptional regulator of sugar metabolism